MEFKPSAWLLKPPRVWQAFKMFESHLLNRMKPMNDCTEYTVCANKKRHIHKGGKAPSFHWVCMRLLSVFEFPRMDPSFPSFPERVSTPSLMVNILFLPEPTPDGSPLKKTCGLSPWASVSFLCLQEVWPRPCPLGRASAQHFPQARPHSLTAAGAQQHALHATGTHQKLPQCCLHARRGSAIVLPSYISFDMGQKYRSLLVKGNPNILGPFLEFSF